MVTDITIYIYFESIEYYTVLEVTDDEGSINLIIGLKKQ